MGASDFQSPRRSSPCIDHQIRQHTVPRYPTYRVENRKTSKPVSLDSLTVIWYDVTNCNPALVLR